MNAPTPPPGANDAGAPAHDAADARELADFLASEQPLDAEAAVWVARQQDGLTPEEEAELQAWLAGDPARGTKMGQLSGLLGQLDELPPDDIAALKAAVSPDIGLLALPPTRSANPPRAQAKPARAQALKPEWLFRLWSFGRLLPRAAFAGVAVMVMGGLWLGWLHWQQQPTFEQRFATARGQQAVAALPEGSTLRLDTATHLDVALYRQRREVQLSQGQALFDVKADPAWPFHVLAGPMRITVLGTRFSVRHTLKGRDAGSVSVVVEEGRVRVAKAGADGDSDGAGKEPGLKGAAAFIELTAGQAVVANAQGHIAAVNAANMGAALAWRDGRVVLNDTPLDDAIAEFERYVDTGLVIHDAEVAALRLNGSFDLRQVSAFKRALPQALPVEMRATAAGETEVVAVEQPKKMERDLN